MPDDLPAGFTAIAASRADALHAFGDPVNFKSAQLVGDFALKTRLPSSFDERSFVGSGGLFSYGSSYADTYYRAANYVDKLLKGAKAAELPIQQPPKFEFVINLKTAKALGLAIPQPQGAAGRRGDRMRTRRAIVFGVLAQALSTTSAPARGQQLAKMPRIGMLWFAGPNEPALVQNMELFRQRLRELGYVEGKTIQIEGHYADGDPQRLSEVAREIARSKVDIVVAPTLIAAVAARQATESIAIVMVQAGNPVGAGLISSLSRPGGNVTGSTNFGYGSKQVEFMHELLPRAKKLAVLTNLANAGAPPNLAGAMDAAHKLGIEVVVASVTRPDEFAQAFATIRNARPHGLLVLSEPVVADRRAQVVDLATSMGLPVCSDSARDARAGHLMSVGSLLSEHFLMAATYVDKILKGAKPADLPVEQPSRFEVIFNLKTAKALGIAVPQSLLLRATEVIE